MATVELKFKIKLIEEQGSGEPCMFCDSPYWLNQWRFKIFNYNRVACVTDSIMCNSCGGGYRFSISK